MLTAAERRALKGKPHGLEPVVQIGAKGLTAEVVAEIERALGALITGVEEVRQVGKVFVLYRKSDNE